MQRLQLHFQFIKLAKNRCGATAIEYALMASLIGVAMIGGMKAFTTENNKTIQCTSNVLTGVWGRGNNSTDGKGACGRYED